MDFGTFALSRQQACAWALAGRGSIVDRVVQVAVALPVSVSASALGASAEALVARHEILRTTYTIPVGRVDGVQLVHRELAPEIRTSTRPLAVVLEEERAPFRLDGSPLRVAVVAPGTADAALVVTLHELAADVASAARVAAELVDPRIAAPDPLQYADYVAWQEDQLAGAAPDTKAPRELRTRVPLLPAEDAPGAAAPGRVVAVPCDAVALHDGARRSGHSDADLVLAAWIAWLARSTGDADIAVAVLQDGRSNRDLDGAIGPFARQLVAAVDVDPDSAFDDLVAATSAALDGAAQSREAAAEPGAMLPAFVDLGVPTGLTVTASAARSQIELRLRAGSVELAAADALPGAVVEQLAGSFAALLAGAIAAPATAIGDLPTLADDDRALAETQSTGPSPAGSPPATTYIDSFEAQAARTPERDAVRAGDERLTYRALDARANQLARVLAARGIQRDARIGVLIDRSPEALVAILGALKTGAAYVPLNREHPVARLAQQLHDAEVTTVVTVAAHASLLPEGVEGIVLDDPSVLDGVDERRPETATAVTPDDPAYVLFTSGSTGAPKGVVITHANLVSYANSLADLLAAAADVAPGDPLRCGVVTSISTDLGNTCIFPPLAAGGCVDFVDAETAMDPFVFAAHRRSHPIDVLKITPSHLDALLRAAGADVLPTRVLVVGGEALSWELVASVRAAAPTLTIINHYGPTETTVGACTFTVPREALLWHTATVPVGRPLPGVTCDVVDRAGQVTGVGVPGELLIGGAGVAAGYCGATASADSRFVEDVRRPGARVYRTGDVVRRLPDGALEFLGRADDQVKIRGHRVEPGEVERLLAQQPDVHQAAVVARVGPGGDLILVAFIVSDSALDTGALRAALALHLPDHMIPTAFVARTSLPRTASGKLDRRALPDHTAPRDTTSSARRGPRTETEALLAAAWAEILGLDEVGIDEDFFTLGGHSLLATQVVARARRAVGVELPLYALFTAPTVAQLAAVVDDLAADAGSAEQGEIVDDAELAALLDGMSDEEIERLLAEE
jgi:amino acid adenylation domain-containing protein